MASVRTPGVLVLRSGTLGPLSEKGVLLISSGNVYQYKDQRYLRELNLSEHLWLLKGGPFAMWAKP